MAVVTVPVTGYDSGTAYFDIAATASYTLYNAGITRVRRWIKSSKVVYNNRTYLPQDLFLETIPYDETREYGRKLVGATVMYGWLYYDKSIREVVKEIVK